MKKKDEELERNKLVTSPDAFIELYNRTVPSGYTRVTIKILNKFRAAHPAIFKYDSGWSIDKHRKRLMDWLFSNSDVR